MDNILNNPLTLSLTTLLSEDLAYFYGILAVLKKSLSGYGFVFYYSLGVIAGDYMLYVLGHLARYIPALKNWVQNKPRKKVLGSFEEFLILTRFIPGTRLPTYLYCGFTSYNPIKFGALLGMSTIFYAVFGLVVLKTFDFVITPEDPLVLKIGFSVSVAFISLMTFKMITSSVLFYQKFGEVIRPLWITWSRHRSLEFWNSWYFYLPFVPYFIKLLIRYRGFSVCLNANPGIHMSGLIGEKKSEIDKLLLKNIPEHYLSTAPYSPEGNLDFPIMVKPDSGMRGKNVELVKNQAALDYYIKQNGERIVIQQYCPYEYEWGVFYVRYPHQTNGEIFSITTKTLPEVIGDGNSSIYQLVMKDPLLSKRFDWIFSNQELDPFYIPKKDEITILGHRGNHSKGCLFYDGEKYLDHAKPIAEVLDRIPGFYIGRIDIKFKSLEELSKGEFKLLELNGAAAESTNIYDPDFTPRQIYQTLARQWDAIFDIGAINTKKSAHRSTLKDFFTEIFRYRRSHS